MCLLACLLADFASDSKRCCGCDLAESGDWAEDLENVSRLFSSTCMGLIFWTPDSSLA